MNRKIIKIIKWFLLLSLIFSSLFLFNYSYFKGNDGIFFLNALDANGIKSNYASFSVDSLTWVLFKFSKNQDHLGLIISYSSSPCGIPYFCYFDVKGCLTTLENNTFWGEVDSLVKLEYIKPYLRSKSAIVVFVGPIGENLNPVDCKVIDIFLNTKRVPYLRSISLQIKTMPIFLKSEFYHLETDEVDPSIFLQIPMLALTVLFSLPYLYFQVIIPPSFSIPFFWLWVGFSVFYIFAPHETLKQIGEKIKELLHKRSNN